MEKYSFTLEEAQKAYDRAFPDKVKIVRIINHKVFYEFTDPKIKKKLRNCTAAVFEVEDVDSFVRDLNGWVQSKYNNYYNPIRVH